MRTNHWERVLRDVEKRGYAVVCDARGFVGPAVAYSVGMPDAGAAPDVVLFGAHPDSAARLVQDLVRRRRAGESLGCGGAAIELAASPAALRALGVVAELYAPYAVRYCRLRGIRPVFDQLVLADARGLLPWQPGHAAPPVPLLWTERHAADPAPLSVS